MWSNRFQNIQNKTAWFGEPKSNTKERTNKSDRIKIMDLGHRANFFFWKIWRKKKYTLKPIYWSIFVPFIDWYFKGVNKMRKKNYFFCFFLSLNNENSLKSFRFWCKQRHNGELWISKKNCLSGSWQPYFFMLLLHSTEMHHNDRWFYSHFLIFLRFSFSLQMCHHNTST